MLSNEDMLTMAAVVAAKALMLEPGESFVVPVDGDEAYLDRCVAEVESALDAQHRAGSKLILGLAEPNQVHVDVVSNKIVISRAKS